MCRICGRTIKCIFDSMPSRTLTHQVPSRRAFTTFRQPRTPTLPSRSAAAAPSLTRALSTLTLSRPASTRSLFTTTTTTAQLLLPRAPATSTTSSIISSSNSTRTFSTTAAVLGHRRRMDTFSPSRRVQKRRHGYLARLRTKSGRKTLKNRLLRGRRDLSW